ncbi:MAG: phosphohydrolase [Phycisphaerae bacterium]|nr:phosphohydrolase [Phycisphaerae bacterium]
MSYETFIVVSWIATAIDLAAALAVTLYRRQPTAESVPQPKIGLARGLLALAAMGVVFLIKLPLLGTVGLDGFGVIRLLYLDMVVALPLLGVVLLASHLAAYRRFTKPMLVAAVLAVLAAPVGIYATFVESYRLRLETARVVLPAGRVGNSPLTIGVLADIQTADVSVYEREAVERLLAQHPDLILLPGDLFHRRYLSFEQELPELRELLGLLPTDAFITAGNVDTRERLRQATRGTSVRFLDNHIVRLTLGDRRITVGGVGLNYGSSEARKTIETLLTDPGDDIRILVSHLPDVVLELPENSRIDLVVSGHTHGGQVQLPLIGPLMTLSRVPAAIAAGGLHTHRGNRIYVSRGVGHEQGQAPTIRFLCPPEISLITLTDRKTTQPAAD